VDGKRKPGLRRRTKCGPKPLAGESPRLQSWVAYELTNRYYRGLEILQALDEPMRLDELAAELEPDAEEVRDRIAYLSTFDRVSRDGDTVRPVE
jgi:hypothetical protein